MKQLHKVYVFVYTMYASSKMWIQNSVFIHTKITSALHVSLKLQELCTGENLSLLT